MKQAILAVSVGTSVAEAEISCIRPVEDALRRTFPDWNVVRAYSSRPIAARMRVETEQEALARLKSEGYQRIVLAPTHIIPGMEYDRVTAAAGELPVSEPLLCCEQDLQWMSDLLAKIADERPLLMMAHGSGGAADAIYAKLREKLPDNVYLACMNGEHSLEGLLPALDALPVKCLTLAPLMLVAGKHAIRDMAGTDAVSWKSILEARGFTVLPRLQGLGALEAVQQRFVDKVRKVL